MPMSMTDDSQDRETMGITDEWIQTTGITPLNTIYP